jgi:hypothetical protein
MPAPTADFESHVLDRLGRAEARGRLVLGLLGAVVVLALLAACGGFALYALSQARPATMPVTALKTPVANPGPPQGIVRVSSSDLFSGDLKRLEPHLGLTSGCVKLEYQGPMVKLKLEPEVWHKGKRERSMGGMGTTLSGPSELSVSLGEATDGQGKPRYRMIAALSSSNGYVASTTHVDAPQLKQPTSSRGPKGLARQTDLANGQSLAVWGYMAGEGANESRGDESVEEMAKRVEWALVLRITVGQQ